MFHVRDICWNFKILDYFLKLLCIIYNFQSSLINPIICGYKVKGYDLSISIY